VVLVPAEERAVGTYTLPIVDADDLELALVDLTQLLFRNGRLGLVFVGLALVVLLGLGLNSLLHQLLLLGLGLLCESQQCEVLGVVIS
jgi:hypothetical protein